MNTARHGSCVADRRTPGPVSRRPRMGGLRCFGRGSVPWFCCSRRRRWRGGWGMRIVAAIHAWADARYGRRRPRVRGCDRVDPAPRGVRGTVPREEAVSRTTRDPAGRRLVRVRLRFRRPRSFFSTIHRDTESGGSRRRWTLEGAGCSIRGSAPLERRAIRRQELGPVPPFERREGRPVLRLHPHGRRHGPAGPVHGRIRRRAAPLQREGPETGIPGAP